MAASFFERGAPILQRLHKINGGIGILEQHYRSAHQYLGPLTIDNEILGIVVIRLSRAMNATQNAHLLWRSLILLVPLVSLVTRVTRERGTKGFF